MPILRLTRGSSLPFLMIGAGLALTSKTVRVPRRGGGGSPIDTARDMLDDATERARELRADVKDGLSSAQSQAPSMAMTRKMRLPASPTTSGAGGAGHQHDQR